MSDQPNPGAPEIPEAAVEAWADEYDRWDTGIDTSQPLKYSVIRAAKKGAADDDKWVEQLPRYETRRECEDALTRLRAHAAIAAALPHLSALLPVPADPGEAEIQRRQEEFEAHSAETKRDIARGARTSDHRFSLHPTPSPAISDDVRGVREPSEAVQRYTPSPTAIAGMRERASGGWVKFADHQAALLAARRTWPLASPVDRDARDGVLEEAARAVESVGNFRDTRRDELTPEFGQPRFDMMRECAAAIRALQSLQSQRKG